ncbi:U11/U12 small nuclear ribonucleoprotein 25 kDa protein [Rhynchospora pubera]|uniref:U11/U12 small nuclear ribonucleoprotein 25 kDa protein n=1 Tax=Rhynchospora pubera TaxID=906938 RepID=A0AAV8G3Q9_9POAL|nr:U11/U12 small nuclear ribonucleoprotein 25 kDa protein [Rhynchospora pubera]
MLMISDTPSEEERNSFVGGNVRPGHHRRRSSFSYKRIPSTNLISLAILKLDNSTFDVQVAKGATISEVKASVEHLFYPLLKEEGINISWSHVWSHFCLCFENQKLTNDKATLRSLGIKDGDKLRFVHHLSMEKRSRKIRSKWREIFELQRSLRSPPMLSEDVIKKVSQSAELIKKSGSRDDINIYRTTLDDKFSEDVQSKSCIFPYGCFSYSRVKGNRE